MLISMILLTLLICQQADELWIHQVTSCQNFVSYSYMISCKENLAPESSLIALAPESSLKNSLIY